LHWRIIWIISGSDPNIIVTLGQPQVTFEQHGQC
jgi:hypothetical protein